MAKYHSNNVAAEICKALGVNPKMMTRMVLTLDINEAAKIEFTGYAEIEDMSDFSQKFRQWRMRPYPELKTCTHVLDAIADEEAKESA